MKKKLIIIITSVFLVIAVIFIVGMVRGKKGEKKTDRIEIVRSGTFVLKLNERGNLEPLIKVEVRSNVEGEIEKLYVDDGYDVTKGQKLLKIDEKQIREEYNQALANHDAAQAEMDRAVENITLNSDRLKSDIQLAESNLKSAQANLEETKARAAQQLSQATTNLTSMENLLEQDRISLKKMKLAVEQAESSEKSARARQENAKVELDRKRELYEKKFVSLQEVQNAEMDYAAVESQYDSARNNVESQKENLRSQEKVIENREMNIKAQRDDLEILKGSTDEQINQADIQFQQAQERLDLLKRSEESEKQIAELAKKSAAANLLRAQSAVNNAKERLEWTTIIAPMNGRIVKCEVEEGEIITSGRSAWSQGPPVMTIADLSKMIVKTSVHEFDIGKVKVGQKVEIKISAYPDDIFEGTVEEISPSGQSLDGIIKFEVMVMITKAPKPLLPGMTADVDIIVDRRADILQLPIEAVIPKETIQIETDIDKEKADELKDKKVKIKISNYPDKEFAGKVVRIAPAKYKDSSSTVTIIMDNSPKELQPETTRNMDIMLSDEKKIANVEARIKSQKEYYVKLVKKEAENTKNIEREEEDRLIKTGERNQNNIEILDGLKKDDKVRVVPVGEEEEKKG